MDALYMPFGFMAPPSCGPPLEKAAAPGDDIASPQCLTPGTESPPARRVVPLHLRRDKPQLSCNRCRKRKLRCDRAQPCSACTKRGIPGECIYPTSQVLLPPVPRPQETRPPRSTSDRIDQMEAQIRALMRSLNEPSLSSSYGYPSPGLAPEHYDYDQLAENFGRLEVQDEEESYVGTIHWAAMLQEITDLKDEVRKSREVTPCPSLTDSASTDVLSLRMRSDPQVAISRADVTSDLPDPETAHVLMSKFFEGSSSLQIGVHKPTFLKQVREFWQEPDKPSIMWIGLFYSVLAIGANHLNGYFQKRELTALLSGTSLNELAELYLDRVAQCLSLGNYTQGTTYTIETMINYLHMAWLASEDTQVQVWNLVGSIVRTAQRMGYHRDPAHSPVGISPFHTEMRRRMWTVVYGLDIVAAAHFGLPRGINPAHCDTRPPLNLVDEDFGLESTAEEIQAAARPLDEDTQMQIALMHNKMLTIMARVLDRANLPIPLSLPETQALEKEVEAVAMTMPPGWPVGEVEGVLRDLKAYNSTDENLPVAQKDPGRTMSRVLISTLYHRTKCYLLRRTLRIREPVGEADVERYNTQVAMRERCIASARQILASQAALERIYRPRGVEPGQWWTAPLMQGSILLSATFLGSYLDHEVKTRVDDCSSRDKAAAAASGSVEPQAPLPKICLAMPHDTEQIITELQRGMDIWRMWCPNSTETRRVATMIDTVIGRVRQYETCRASHLLTPCAVGAETTFMDMSSPYDDLVWWGVGVQNDLADYEMAVNTAPGAVCNWTM